jgi:hypothetical protein
MLKVYGLAVLIVFLSPGANAQQVPSDLELSAAYCLGSVQSRLDESLTEHDNDPDWTITSASGYAALCRNGQQIHRDIQQTLRQGITRLQEYLVAKGFGSSPNTTTAYGLAFNRGKADTAWAKARVPTQQEEACTHACVAQPSSAEQTVQCFKQCPVDDWNGSYASVGRCGEVLKELPF